MTHRTSDPCKEKNNKNNLNPDSILWILVLLQWMMKL